MRTGFGWPIRVAPWDTHGSLDGVAIEYAMVRGINDRFWAVRDLGTAARHYASAMDRYDLDGKVALVTGAARGIGFETASELARRGARLALGERVQRVVRQVDER